MGKKFEWKGIDISFPPRITFRWGKKEPKDRMKGSVCNAHNSVHYTKNYESYKSQDQ